MSIKAEQVTKLYGTQKALNQVSFSVSTGEVVGLLGPNGAGKSTLMKIITCFLPPNSGQVEVCGLNVLENSLEVRKNVGYLPEHNPLYPEMYILEFLEFIADIHKLGSRKKQRIEEIIAITGLEWELHKKIGMLSRGYRQRVGLAQALIHDPEVLILDEPTSGLDPNQLLEIRHLINKIGKQKTVMLSTHIMQEVEAVCDRAIIIDKGIIVADSSTNNLHKGFANRELFHVEFDRAVSAELISAISEVKKLREKSATQFELESEKGVDLRPVLFQFAVDNQLTILTLQREEQSLEAVFQALTKKN